MNPVKSPVNPGSGRQTAWACVLLLTLGCRREQSPEAAQVTPQSSASAPAEPAHEASAADALDRMDPRSPVPLLPMMANHQKQNMRDHLVAVQEIVSAMAASDFAGVERAAGRMGFSDAMAQMCNHMGAGAPGFSERALEFHHAADKIAEAARDQDAARVLSELGTTLQTCTSCHALYKQQVVTEATWQELTDSSPPSHTP